MTSPKNIQNRGVGKSDRSNAGFAAIIVAIAAATSFARATLLGFPSPDADRDEVSTVWHPILYRLVTFGHAPAAVDVQLLRFMTDGRINKVKTGDHPKVFYYLDLATDVDPKFYGLYTGGSNFLTVVRNDAKGALHLISKGEEFRKNELPKLPEKFQTTFWPDPWRIPFIKGYIHLFEMLDREGAEQSYSVLSTIPGTPEMVRSLGTNLRKPDGIYGVGERALETMYNTATDDQVRAEVRKKQISLRVLRFLRDRNIAFSEWLQKSPTFRKQVETKKWPELLAKHLEATGTPAHDPFGGSLFVTEEGRIDSTTPRVEVLGLK